MSKIISSSLVAVVTVLSMGSFSIAQSPVEIKDVRGDVQTLQDRFAESYERLELIGVDDVNTVDTMAPRFFDISNVSIWLVWAMLLGVLLLLIAIRGNLRDMGVTYSEAANKSYQRSAGKSAKRKGKPLSLPRDERKTESLVHPVKVVKIKVRKVKTVKK